MNTFFNANFSTRAVQTAWRERKNQLRAQQLQDHNDYLYEVVSADILSRRADLYNALIHAINTAQNPQNLTIPLWTYHTSHYKNRSDMESGDTFFERMETKLRRKGYHWLVGTVGHGFTPNANSVLNETEEDGYVGSWDHVWGWARKPRSVHEVVRLTDFRNRIALLFGDDGFRVSYQTVAWKNLHNPLEVVVEKVELRLHYHPNGLYDSTRKALLDTKLKYQSYASQRTDTWRVPYVWTGVPDHRETVKTETPGFSNETPAPAPVPASPPPLARRTNGGGLSAEDFAEVSRILNYEEAPASVQASAPEYPDGSQLWGAESLLNAARGSIHVYEGADAFRRAAEDTVNECTGNVLWRVEGETPVAYPLPCHCDYHRPEAE